MAVKGKSFREHRQVDQVDVFRNSKKREGEVNSSRSTAQRRKWSKAHGRNSLHITRLGCSQTFDFASQHSSGCISSSIFVHFSVFRSKFMLKVMLKFACSYDLAINSNKASYQPSCIVKCSDNTHWNSTASGEKRCSFQW